MLATISTWIVIVTMLFGGSGVTALAAENSLPSDYLYPIKIFGEELHLALSSDPESRMELRWRYSERRIGEILDMLGEGQSLSQEWEMRWNEQFNLALQATAELDDAAMIQALERSDLRLRLQEQRLQSVQANRPDDLRGDLERVRAQLHQQQWLIDNALGDPPAFRRRLGERQRSADQTRNGPLATTPLDDRGGGLGPGPQSTPPCVNCTPALDGTGSGPGPRGTPSCENCTPSLDGTGPGPGPQSTPICDNCTPALDGTGPGPGPQHQGDDQSVQSPDDGGGSGESGEGGSGQGSSRKPPDHTGSGSSGGGNENSDKGGGTCDSCGSGGSPRRP